MSKPISVTITMNVDGTFRLESTNGPVANYSGQHMVLALEETVLRFRGKKVRLTTIAPTATPVVPEKTPRYSSAAPANEATERYNGGLGPKIKQGTEFVNGGLPFYTQE